jgi:hypothetical protein
LTTNNKDFRIKNGLIVDGANATVNGNDVITSAASVNALSDVTISSPTSGQVLKWNGTAWINDTDVTGTNFTGYDYEIHVSQVDGNDTTGNGDLLTPVASITKALTLVTSQRKTVIIHPGTYTESPSITTQYTTLTGPGLIGGNIVISGTVSTSTGCTISGLKMTNLTVTTPTATGNVNILNCEVSGTFTKSSNADYVVLRLCDLSAASITGAGLVAIFGGNPNFITVNNASANVIVKSAITVAPVLTAGTLSLVDSVVGAAVTNAVTSAASSVITLANCQFLTSALTGVAPVVLNGFYSILNCVYDKPNSTLVASSGTGGTTNSIDYFQYINADKFITQGGTSAQFVKGDGSLDSVSPGAAGNSFETISANGTSVVADSSTDTLTITPGSGMSIVGNATSDTVTFSVDYAEKIYYLVRNNTGSTIPKGTLVSASGAEPSGRIDVAPHSTTGTQDSELRVMGMTTANISNGVNGEVISFGTLVGIDTRGDTASAIAVGDETWAEGDILYAHPTVAGKLTKVRPQHDLAVAFITVRHASTGQIAVRIIPGNHHLEWLHDVAIDGTPADNELLAYNSASSLWINQTAEEAGVANLSGATFTGNVAGTNISMSGNVNATTVNATSFIGSGASLTSIPNSATTANSANGASTIVARDANGSFTANVVNATTFNGIHTGNYIINGGFDFWQRGTSFTASGYTADRWYFYETGVCTISQETTSLPTGFIYALKAFASTSNDYAEIAHYLESATVRPLRGKTVTFSAYLKMDANMRSLAEFYFYPQYGNTTDTRAATTREVPGATPVELTKSNFSDWARMSYTFVVPADAVTLELRFTPPFTTVSVTTSTYWITGAQLEVGSVATDFRRAGSTYTEEQNACYRYYYRAIAESAYGWFGQMHHPSTVLGLMPITVPVNMRTIPSVIESSAIGAFQYFGATGTLSSLSLSSDGSNSRQITVNVNGSGFAVNGSGFLRASNNVAAFIGIQAEL